MSVCENESVLFDNEAGPVGGGHGLAGVVVTNAKVLDLESDNNLTLRFSLKIFWKRMIVGFFLFAFLLEVSPCGWTD